MPYLVIQGGLISCSGSPTTIPLAVPTPHLVTATAMNVATIMDYAPTNIATFGTCSSPTNPAVIAAQGSPVPCTPAILLPWAPGCTMVTIGGVPALHDGCTAVCTLGGAISVSFAGQVLVEGT